MEIKSCKRTFQKSLVTFIYIYIYIYSLIIHEENVTASYFWGEGFESRFEHVAGFENLIKMWEFEFVNSLPLVMGFFPGSPVSSHWKSWQGGLVTIIIKTWQMIKRSNELNWIEWILFRHGVSSCKMLFQRAV